MRKTDRQADRHIDGPIDSWIVSYSNILAAGMVSKKTFLLTTTPASGPPSHLPVMLAFSAFPPSVGLLKDK